MTELPINNASNQTLAGSGTVISAILAARVTITVQEKNSILSDLAVTLSDDYYQNILSLLGNYNGDKKDDFQPKNGSASLPWNATIEQIHYQFGLTCKDIQLQGFI